MRVIRRAGISVEFSVGFEMKPRKSAILIYCIYHEYGI